MAGALSDVSSTLKFAKLNGANYRSWAFNIRLYLESMDLFEFADGTAVSPASTPVMKCEGNSTCEQRRHGIYLFGCRA